jgi:hypothetical protein
VSRTTAYVRLADVGEDADGLLVVLPRRKRVSGSPYDIEIMVVPREDGMRELEKDEVFVDLTRRAAPTIENQRNEKYC